MFEAHSTFNTYDRLRAHASTFRSTDHITKSINNSYPAPFSSPSNEMDYHRSGVPMQQSSITTNGIFPRSASEAQFDTTSKFRQLPCRTFISVGTCPYRERCVYLHDPRCICKEAKTKTRRKNKEDVVLDSLFWPVMPYPMVAGKLDMNRQPHVIQSYSVPIPQYDQYHTHDAAVYSLWMHFVDFCMANNESSMNMYNMPTATTTDTAPCYCAPNEPVNSYTNQSRLQIFQFFASCHGCTVSPDEVLHSSSRNMPINARHVHIPRVARTTTAPATSIPPPVMFKAPPLQDPIASSHHHHLYSQSGAHTRVSELYDQQQQQGRGGVSIPSSFAAAAGDQTSRHSPGGNYPSRVPYNQDTSATAMHAHYTQYQQQNSSDMGRYSPQPTAATATTASSAQYTHRRNSSSSLSPVTATMERSPQLADHALNPTAAVFTSHTMKSSQYQDTSHIRSPPTSMSVLNSIPQSNDTQHQQQQQKVRSDFLLEISDPWAADSCYSGGITDDERDSGSSFNSDSIQDDMNAIWKKPNFSTISASTNNSSNSNKGVTVSTRNNSFSMLNSAITAAAGVGAALSYAL